MEKKEYLITKISDQKEKKYEFFRSLEVDENELPLKKELDDIVTKEEPDKNVAFFMGNSYITMFSYRKKSKFIKKVMREFYRAYGEDDYQALAIATDEDTYKFLQKSIDDFRNMNAEIVANYIGGPVRKINE